MTDPRTSTALRSLSLDDPPQGRWRWAVAEPERSGRVRLPAHAVGVLGEAPAVWARIHGDALQLSPEAGRGRRIGIDGRGRLYLPVWLRRPAVLVATAPAHGLVLAVDAALIDPVADRLLAEVQR
jgi:hypothetical protein